MAGTTIERDNAPPRSAAMWRPVASGLWLLAIAIAVTAGASFVVRLLSTGVFVELRSLTDFDLQEPLFDKLTLYYRISSIVDIAASTACVVGLIGMARAPLRWPRRLAWFTAAAFAVMLAGDIAYFADGFSDDRISWLYGKPMRVFMIVLPAAISTALLLYLVRVADILERRLPGFLVGALAIWILWWVGYPIARMIDPVSSFARDHAWMHALLFGSARLVGYLGFVFALITVARVVAVPAANADDEAAQRFDSSGWRVAADGLELYGDALAWRLGLAIAGYGLILLAVAGKSIGLIKMVAWSLPLAMLITGVAMIVGLYKFSQQPAPSPGRGPAYAGFVGMLLSAALEAYGFILVLDVVTADAKNYSAVRAAEKAAAQAQSLSVWSMALGFAALVAVLYSFSQVARYVGRAELNSRVTAVSILLVSAAVVAVGFRIYVVDARLSPSGLITLAFAVAIYALIAVVSYLGLTRAVERGMREVIGGASELPAARVVGD